MKDRTPLVPDPENMTPTLLELPVIKELERTHTFRGAPIERPGAAKVRSEPAFMLFVGDRPIISEPARLGRPTIVGVPRDLLQQPSRLRVDRMPTRAEAQTVLELPVVSEADLAALEALEAPPAECLTRIEIPQMEEPPATEQRFSETAWFMSAVSEELSEGPVEAQDYNDMDEMTRRYERPRTLPGDVRREFSLEVEQ